MHLELVVPGLLGARVAESLPALELLLIRGRQSECERAGLEDWLKDKFGIREKTIPAGALTALALGIDPGTRYWLRADPVHLRADRDRLLLFPNQGFSLPAEEAEQLGAALTRHFSDQFTLRIPRPDAWLLETAIEAEADAKPPIELAGVNVDAHLPGKRWHALLNEIQMALYQHPVNTAREERGEPVVNSVWLWGGGKLPAAARAPWQSVSADDPVALGLARLSGAQRGDARAGSPEWLAGAPAGGRHLVVLDALRAPRAFGDETALARAVHALEKRWFAPLLDSLKAGRVGMVTVHVPDAGASFETIRGDLRRFWRRPKPLASYGS
jgi:hypothetical protein